MHKKIFLLIFILNLTSLDCFSQKKEQFLKQGIVRTKDYLVEIPFHYVNKHIFIEVLIDNKKYNFLFDTGYELSAIDQDLANEINYSSKRGVEVSGSSINTEQVRLVELPTITISTINFENTCGILQNLSVIKSKYDSLKVAGVIGNNLIRKANWQIDYKKKVIRISDGMDRFTIPQTANVVKMSKRKWGISYIDLFIDSKKHKFIVDSGSNGRFTMDLTKSDPSKKEVVAQKVKLGDIELHEQTISLEKGVSSLVGNAFFQDYQLTIDWNNNLLYLVPQSEPETKN